MRSRVLIGAGLLAAGIIMFLISGGKSIGPGTMIGYLWPSMFVIPLGLFFHWMYFSLLGGRTPGLLVPGGVLITAGVVCQIAMVTDGWGYMWPGFIFAAAVGLFELYFFGGRNKWLLIPINILTVLSAMFFIVFSIGAIIGKLTSQPIVAIGLILAGAVVLVGWRRRTE